MKLSGKTFIELTETGNVTLIKKAIEVGANVHAYNNYALRWASRNGHLEVVQLLKQYGAKLN